ncbi:radical SAM family heme chaperone HemW [Microbacterium sp. CnD16-F]|uniref:radical SAM family heme chaperone HemW n=1 Tax=Microbacterium sp. CnD16-F TaxID=2954493 RepID=UPI002096A3C2|nr:radical SAM family heme chaperone HemW [Microbacterium sp. CnD16-F]MCO7202861.1 radical SAM family heme chaperone HemW [Microbacterium sp. CnD16-F]
MGSALPLGDPAPLDGALPADVRVSDDVDFGVYLHVPFCRVRCGYCDFNTYTATELRGARQDAYADEVLREIAISRRVLAERGPLRPAQTVFFGGGTPTLLPPGDLARMLDGVREAFGLADGAEVTVEANPDTMTDAVAETLAAAGVTRLSIGMQSAVPHVLAALDRTHDPANIATAVAAARNAGLAVSLDLIYGAPGESLEDWRTSLETATALAPDHVSAYALIVEDGTKLERQIRRGEVPAPDDDLQADMYELADELLAAAGYGWYEVSNWATNGAQRSRHNLSYWRGQDWWGYGPGAHSHIGGLRWWNVKHPAAYAQRLAVGQSPAAGRERPDAEARRLEDILLRSRIVDGVAVDEATAIGRRNVASLIADGLVDGAAAVHGTIVLTRRGRLLADAVVRALTE